MDVLVVVVVVVVVVVWKWEEVLLSCTMVAGEKSARATGRQLNRLEEELERESMSAVGDSVYSNDTGEYPLTVNRNSEQIDSLSRD